jgi:hypothetical protein
VNQKENPLRSITDQNLSNAPLLSVVLRKSFLKASNSKVVGGNNSNGFLAFFSSFSPSGLASASTFTTGLASTLGSSFLGAFC